MLENLQVPNEVMVYIADKIGGRDHTTVMHAHDKITNTILNDPLLEKKLMK